VLTLNDFTKDLQIKIRTHLRKLFISNILQIGRVRIFGHAPRSPLHRELCSESLNVGRELVKDNWAYSFTECWKDGIHVVCASTTSSPSTNVVEYPVDINRSSIASVRDLAIMSVLVVTCRCTLTLHNSSVRAT